MSTRDENIKDDLLFLKEFYPYANFDGSMHPLDVYTDLLHRGEIQIETFIENAIASVAGIQRASVNAHDLSDGSEVKKVISSFRNNNASRGQWTNSFEVKGVKGKTGPLRIIGLNRYAKKFEFFFVPRIAYSHITGPALTLPIETWGGYYSSAPAPTGIRSGSSVWHKYQEPDFITMCRKGLIGPFPDIRPIPSTVFPSEQHL